MLHKLKSNYQSIAKHFPGINNRLSSDEYKKQRLLDTAKKGDKRPGKNTSLGKALSLFTRKKSKKYDPIFTTKIKKLRQDWFFVGVDLKSVGADVAKRGYSFLSKFKLLTMLLNQDRKEIFSKDKLWNLYFENNTRSIKNAKTKQAEKVFLCRTMNVFESIGLVLSCDEKGNKINIKKAISKNKFTQRFWKISKDIDTKLGFRIKSKLKRICSSSLKV